MLEIKKLYKIFKSRDKLVRAVDDVSLKVDKGEFLAIQGASGSGKTTLLLCIGGLQSPDDGNVTFNGRDIYQMNNHERTKFRSENIGFIFQQFHLIPYLTVEENILAPSLAFPRNGALERARELIEKFNLTERAGHKPSELSTGECQRTAMARALLNDPGLLLADEPTGNLDKENANIVLGCLSELAASGKTVIMVTHSEEAATYSSREIHIKNGKIIK